MVIANDHAAKDERHLAGDNHDREDRRARDSTWSGPGLVDT
jgi:hypothetical protein